MNLTSPPGAKPRVIVVLGMHRSGSSALTRGLQAMGVSLGDNLMPPVAENNEKGFFEDLDIYQLNERLLNKAHSSWHSLASLESASLAGPLFSAERMEAAALLHRKLAHGLFGFKDPRTAVLLPFWQCVFEDLDLDDRYVISVRNPIETAVSLEKRDGLPLTKGVLLWAKHVIEALRHTENKPRVLVGYERLLTQPVRELGRIAAALDLPVPDFESAEVKAYCEEFLSPALRHNRTGAGELERSGLAPRFAIELYGAVGALTADDGEALADETWRSILARYEELAPLLRYADATTNALTASRAELTRQAETIQGLNERLRELENREAELAKAIADAGRAATAQEAQLSQATAALEIELKRADEALSRQAELAAALDEARRAAAAREAEVGRSTEALRLSAAREADLIAALNAERQAFAASRTELDGALQAIAQMAERQTELSEALEDARRSSLAREAELTAALEGALSGADLREDELKASLAAALDNAAAQQAQLRASLQAAEQREQEWRSRVMDLQQTLDSSRRSAEARSDRESQLRSALDAAKQQIERLNSERQHADEQAKSAQQAFRDMRRDLLLTRAALTEVRSSTSWRLTAPLRGIATIARNPVRGAHSVFASFARSAWRRLPMTPAQRGRLAASLFSAAPALFSRTRAYRAWAVSQGRDKDMGMDDAAAQPPDPALEGYVPLSASSPPQSLSARAIAFYLPQFHPIPENDRWWGQGFTEWTKVRAAAPLFDGHQQPREPGELGYYDLLADEGVMARQAELAQLHGLSGFCFYFYWFAGKRLLEAPIQRYHRNSDIQLPFCLCWANENWTRRWDGKAHEVLIAQQHSAEDDIAFIAYVSQYFRDERYIRINGRPLLVVYRPALLPSPSDTASRWRRWLRENGFGEVYLAYTQSFESVSPARYGFDAAIEFPPNNTGLPREPKLVTGLASESRLSIYDWRRLVARSARYTKPPYKLFRGVTPSWDNTPRRPREGAVFVNASPSAFRQWLTNAVRDTSARFSDPEERLVFINAWNEWAEGACLEPDKTHGYAWLEAARQALDAGAAERRVLIVTHDLHRHGAQYLALNLARTLKRHFGLEIVCISGQAGEMAAEFEREASLVVLDMRSAKAEASDAALSGLAARGFRRAIVNSAASGWIAPRLARHGVRMIGLVHEMPQLIGQMKLQRSLADLDRHADALVFPAATVRDKNAAALGLSWRNAKMLPQGLYKSGVLTVSEKENARRRIARRLNLPDDAHIVLGVGYADARKGVDIFIAWAKAAAARWPNVHFVWLGKIAPEWKTAVERAKSRRIHFVGQREDTQDYYAAARIYALPSREDPFPSTALEALAAAAPVIMVSGTGGIEELVSHGCVRAIASPAPEHFIAAAAPWMEDDRAVSAAGEAGRNLVREKFGFASYAGALTDLLGLGIPDVSVIVPNYNYARHLEQRLASILAQTLSPREIIVLDDASTDDSIAVAERALARSPVNWRIVRNAQNSGNVFAQWRKGAELAQGELLWIAEADDWAEPGFLETATAAFRRPDVVLSMTQSRQAGSDGRILAGDYLDYVRDISPDKWRRAFVGDGAREVREGLAIKNTIPNVSAVTFRRAPLLKTLQQHAVEIGAYRVAGDWCVYVNLLREGALAFSPAALNTHRRHDESVTISRFGLPELAEIARMQAYVAREFSSGTETAQKARAYLEVLVKQFGLSGRHTPAQIEAAMRGVVEALSQRA